MSQPRQRLIDLDEVATELASRKDAWCDQGITSGPLTWRDAQASWPQPIHTNRSLVAEPESVGITLTTANETRPSSSSGAAAGPMSTFSSAPR